MFVNNEITDRGLLHKLLRKEAGKVTMDERTLWARSIENAIKDASRPSTPVRMRITRPGVVRAAAPALSAVAEALRNGETGVSRESLDAIQAFMTDGVDSPLYGRDPLASGRAAEDLRKLVVTSAFAQRRREVAQSRVA
ncbi:MAG TPA: hypothetical protein VFD90_01465 [Gaiellales bacterium]|jgi:hypothetical protein|nr:hypothetical protein [Gaiellales bacterium]